MKLDNNNVIMFDFRIQIKLKSIFTKHISVIINCDFLLCVPVVARFSLVIFWSGGSVMGRYPVPANKQIKFQANGT